MATVEARDALALIVAEGGFASGSTALPGSSSGSTGSGEGSNSGGATSTNGASSSGGGGAVADSGGSGAAGDEQAGPRPCTAPSDETGVSDSTIRVGTITTLSGVVPGLGESSGAAVRAYAAYLNANGGLCGRQVEVVLADDGMDNGKYRSIYQEQAGRVLGIVGGIGGGDAGGNDIAGQTGVPTVSNPISFNYWSVPNVFGMKPPYSDPNMSIGKYEWLASQGVTKAAIVYTSVAQTRSEYENFHRRQIEAAGIQIVHKNELDLATLNYDAAASAVYSSGAQYMMMQGETTMVTGMARSMKKIGDAQNKTVQFKEYLPGYSPDFIDAAGAAAEGSYAFLRTLPNEEAGSNAEQDKFLEWMALAAPGSPADAFAADAWTAAKAFFDVVAALPGPITREAILDGLEGIQEYDADGMMGPINFGSKQSRGCFIGMVVRDGTWTRVVPDSGFLC